MKKCKRKAALLCTAVWAEAGCLGAGEPGRAWAGYRGPPRHREGPKEANFNLNGETPLWAVCQKAYQVLFQ